MTIDLTDSGGTAAHLMNLPDVADELGTSLAAVEDLVTAGRFPVPTVTVAGRTLVGRAQFESWAATIADGGGAS